MRNAPMPLEARVGIAFTVSRFCKLSPTPPPRGYTWAPADFGEARMAGLGWLVSLADREQPSRMDQVIARFRAAAMKTPANLHDVWNWFYLCAARRQCGCVRTRQETQRHGAG